MSTEPNADYRFITTIDCKALGWHNSNSEGLQIGEQPWGSISLHDDENEIVTIRIDIEYMVRVDITNVPTKLRSNIKIIAIDESDVPSGVVLPLEVIEYGSVIVENKPAFMTQIYSKRCAGRGCS